MSGTLPTSPSFQTLNIKSNTFTSITAPITGRAVRKTQGVQLWSFTASYPADKRSVYAPLMAFIVKQQGQFETFTAKLPEYSDTNGALDKTTQTMLINNAGGYNVGTKALAVSVSPTGGVTTGALKAGDFIGFGFHNKVYMLTADLDLDGAGLGTLQIEPGLIDTVANDETVVYGDVQFTCRLSEDIQEFSAGLGNLVRYELDIIEDL